MSPRSLKAVGEEGHRRGLAGVDLLDETALAVRANDVVVVQEVNEAGAAVAPKRRRGGWCVRVHYVRRSELTQRGNENSTSNTGTRRKREGLYTDNEGLLVAGKMKERGKV